MKKRPKIILISGGSRGLGKEVIQHLLEKTPNTIITFSRQTSPFVQKLLKKFPSRFFYTTVDLSSSQDVQGLAGEIQKKFKRLDVLINNAGIAREGVLPIFPENEIEQVLNINLAGTIRLTRMVSRLMIQQNSGSIINISSIIGLRGYAGLSVYSASKAGLIGFTKSLARELGRRNIRVNAIAPGYLETEMSQTLNQGQRDQIIRRTPLGRLGKAEDVISTINYLISEGSDFITGNVFVIDGGISC